MIIEPIRVEDFYKLQKLHRNLTKLVSDINDYQATDILIQELKEVDSLAIGLYKSDKLVGYTLGFYWDKVCGFYYSGIYILPEYRYYTLKLLKESEKYLKLERNYNRWYTEANTVKGKNLLEKYGAENILNNLYTKEIKWVV